MNKNAVLAIIFFITNTNLSMESEEIAKEIYEEFWMALENKDLNVAAKLLQAKKIDLNRAFTKSGAKGMLPLKKAADSPMLVQLLLNAGANPNIKDEIEKGTILHWIISRINFQKKMIEFWLNLMQMNGKDAQNNIEGTNNSINLLVQSLQIICLQSTVDLDIKNGQGKTVWDLAGEYEKIKPNLLQILNDCQKYKLIRSKNSE